MSSLALPLLALGLAAAVPPEGTYEIVRDQLQVERKVWGLFCVAPEEGRAFSVGARVTLTCKGSEWHASGAGRRFGTATCEGENPTLKAVERRREGEWIVFTCQSQRVTRGTETTIHRLRAAPDGSFEWRTRGEHEFRKDGDLCLTRYERVILR